MEGEVVYIQLYYILLTIIYPGYNYTEDFKCFFRTLPLRGRSAGVAVKWPTSRAQRCA